MSKNNLGLIGRSLAHSFSKTYFEDKFNHLNLKNWNYDLYEIEDITRINNLVEDNCLKGFNVTIPYKQDIIKFLDEISEEAKAIGAVNTVTVNEDGKLAGYNTDAYGFHQMIKPFIKSHHEKALILGTGGASKAVAHVLDKIGITYLYVSRNPRYSNQVSYKDLNENAVKYFPLIINTTPVGTYPKTDIKPDIPYAHLTDKNLLVDLVYNPEVTAFMKAGKTRGSKVLNGLTMLHQQAEKAWSYFSKG